MWDLVIEMLKWKSFGLYKTDLTPYWLELYGLYHTLDLNRISFKWKWS